MNVRVRQLGLLVALPILLVGCATQTTHDAASGGAHSAATSPSPSPSMSPGMSMSGGAPAAGAADTGPSESARMICGPEIRRDVATTLALPAQPPTTTTWANHLYTCTYRLPVGPLVLSVQESTGAATARTYFEGLRQRLGTARPLIGLAALGLPSYDTPSGTIVFLKDTMTLQVDASRLPAVLGPQHDTRSNVAYTVASDILGCWTGK